MKRYPKLVYLLDGCALGRVVLHDVTTGEADAYLRAARDAGARGALVWAKGLRAWTRDGRVGGAE